MTERIQVHTHTPTVCSASHMMRFTNVRAEFIDNSWKSESSSSLVPPDMECVCVWLVCVCMLRMCVEAQSSLDKGDHDHLDHQHHHLVSDGNAASGKTHSGRVCVCAPLSCRLVPSSVSA